MVSVQYKDYFGITVAGYPEGHLSAKSIEEVLTCSLTLPCECTAFAAAFSCSVACAVAWLLAVSQDIKYLKEKVDAGIGSLCTCSLHCTQSILGWLPACSRSLTFGDIVQART